MKKLRITALLIICFCIILLFCSCFEQISNEDSVLEDESEISIGTNEQDQPKSVEITRPIETRLMINHYGQWYEVGYDENNDLLYMLGDIFRINTYSWVTGSKDSPEAVQALAAAQVDDANYLPFSLYNYYAPIHNPTGKAEVSKERKFWATFNGKQAPECLSIFHSSISSVYSPIYFSFPEGNEIEKRRECFDYGVDFYECLDYNDILCHESDYCLPYLKVDYDEDSNPIYYGADSNYRESLYYNDNQDLYRYVYASQGADDGYDKEYSSVSTGWDPDRRLAWKRETHSPRKPDIIYERAYNERGLVSGVVVYTYTLPNPQKNVPGPFNVRRLIRFEYDEQNLLSMVSEISLKAYPESLDDFSDVEALLLCDQNELNSETVPVTCRYDYIITRDSRNAIEKIYIDYISYLFGGNTKNNALRESMYRPFPLKEGESAEIPGIGIIDHLYTSVGEYCKDPEHPESEGIRYLGKSTYSVALRFTNTGKDIITTEQLSAGPKWINYRTESRRKSFGSGELTFFGRKDPILPGESRTFVISFALEEPIADNLPVYAVLKDSFVIVTTPHEEYDEELFDIF